MSLYTALKERFPKADFSLTKGNVRLQDDGDGPYVVQWDEAVLGPRPTKADIAAMIAADAATPPRAETPREKIERMLAERGITLADLKAELSK